MKINYCTLFDSGYLPKGWAMIRSLLQYWNPGDEIQVHVLALDERVANFLSNCGYEEIKVTRLSHVLAEDAQLRKAKTDRDHTEFCWTLASYWLEDRIRTTGERFTYLDADLFFFDSPYEVLNEMGDAPVAIVPHNFPDFDRERLKGSGDFNVSWVTIDPTHHWVAKRWRDQCLAKCSRDICGDQRYLNEWPELVGPNLYVFKNPGIGTAPWNIGRFTVRDDGDRGVILTDKQGEFNNFNPLIFYHYHEFKKQPDGTYTLTGYKLPDGAKELIYDPYIREYERAESETAEKETWGCERC